MTTQPPPGPLRIRSEEQALRLLGKLRQLAGLTQADLAKKLRVSPSTVKRREQTRLGVYAAALIETADALGYDIALIPRRPKEQP
jgi:transcriptional regulator with XRE-family HTH domain